MIRDVLTVLAVGFLALGGFTAAVVIGAGRRRG